MIYLSYFILMLTPESLRISLSVMTQTSLPLSTLMELLNAGTYLITNALTLDIPLSLVKELLSVSLRTIRLS